MILLFVGLGVLLVSLVPLWISLIYRRKARLIQRTETSTASELEDLRAHAAAAVGPGYFARVVELKGIGECPSPLTAPVTQTPCAAYRTLVKRESEEERWERDAQGRSRSQRYRSSETVSRDERTVDFLVRDATGTVRVDPSGAKIEYEKVADRFEPAPQEGATIAFGAFSFTVPGGLSGSHTLGYRTTEEVLPLGRPLYVLGEVSDSGGGLLIAKSPDSSSVFLVTYRSESEVLASNERWVRWLRVGAAGVAITGLSLIAAGAVVLAF